MLWSYCYTDTLYTISGTRIHQYTGYRPVHSYFIFLHHCYIDSPVYMHWLSMSSCYMDHWLYYYSWTFLHSRYINHCLCHMDYCYMSSSSCIPVLILIFPLLDTWAVDMRCMESHIYCSRFPLSCSMLSTELRSCYHVTCTMHCICFCYTVYFKYHKYNLGIGETWRLIRSYRVDVWILCLSHCRGRGSAGYRLLRMSSRFPLLF